MKSCIQGPVGLTGAQGSQGAQGTAGANTKSCESVGVSDNETAAVSSPGGEGILYEFALNYLPLVDNGTPFPWGFYLGFIGNVSLSDSNVRVRVGATNPGSIAGSTVVLCKVVSGLPDQAITAYGTVAAQPATNLVQITGTPAGNTTLTLRGINLQVTCATPGRAVDMAC